MHTAGTFSVESFEPTGLVPTPPVDTGTPVGVATMTKGYEGGVSGRSSTLFTAAFDQATGVGTYVATESFEGALGELTGTFVFVHSATTSRVDRSNEFFTIVPTSGTGELATIRGTGGLTIDVDGTHRVWFDYDLD